MNYTSQSFYTNETNFIVFFYVLLTVHLSIILVINQLNAQNLVFLISLLYASTFFEHYVLIIRRSKLCYTASVIVTPCRWPSGAQVESGLKFFFYNKLIIRLYMFRALCAHHQEVKIVLYSIWYRHTL